MRIDRWKLWGLCLLTGLAGCGDDSGEGGAGGGSTTASASSSRAASSTGSGSGSSGAATSGTSATTSASSSDASSTGSAMCPPIQCDNACAMDFWPELDGCDSCACQATLAFAQDQMALPTQHVSITAVASVLIGGIDRWQLDFTWNYDDPQASDDAETLVTSVRIPVMDLTNEPGANNEMRTYMGGAGEELEMMGGEWTLFGFAQISETLAPAGGFVSIRRNGMTFEGFASLDFTSTSSPKTFHVGGPFTAAIPPI